MRRTDFCHPNETTCTRTSRVPGSLSPLSRRGHPTESLAPCGWPGDRTFHDVHDRFGGSSSDRVTRALLPHGLETRSWALSSHGDDAIEPLTSLSRLLVHSHASPAFAWCCLVAVCASFVAPTGRRMRGPPKTTVVACSWKPTLRDDPGRLPSVGTLHRIRWPLQPRPRDRRTAFGDVTTAGWRSLVTLGHAPVLSRIAPVRPTRDSPFAWHARRRYHPPTLAPR